MYEQHYEFNKHVYSIGTYFDPHTIHFVYYNGF